MFDFTILTDDRYVNPLERNYYINNILFEDGILIKELEKLNFKVNRVSWSDSKFDWANTGHAIFKTTWDYFDRLEEFTDWLDNTSKLTKFINSYRLVKWNLDKHYLLDLQLKKIPIVDTKIIEPNSKTSLLREYEQHSNKKLVIKPAISGASRHTYVVDKNSIGQYDSIFTELNSNEAWLIQPFVSSIMTKGEISLIMIGGKYSHAVLKIAKNGDFRVQDDFGGTVHDYKPSNEEIKLAEQTISACPEIPLYARVDIVWNERNEPLIGELELIEPELFFRNRPESAADLARVIAEIS